MYHRSIKSHNGGALAIDMVSGWLTEGIQGTSEWLVY